MERKGLIGVFDSGIGGLNVLHACAKKIPDADFLYLGDNGNAPYGEKSEEEIYSLVQEGVQKLRDAGACMVVLACNTATAVCVERLRARYDFPIVGTEPAVKPAARYCSRPLVIATPRTAESVRLRNLIEEAGAPYFHVVGCPYLAGEIEKGGGRVLRARLSELLPWVECDGVVLGCTHYLYLKKQISAHYRAPMFDGTAGTVRRVNALYRMLFCESQGGLTTEWGFLGRSDHQTKTNICLSKLGEFCHISQNNVIYFLGEWKNYNKIRYEQMFIFHFGR